MEVVYTRMGSSNPKGICKLHEEVAQMPMVPSPVTIVSQHAPMDSLAVPYNQLIEERRLGPG